MRLDLLEHPAQLAEIRDRWRQLAADMPLRGPAWLESWWQAFGPGHALRVLAVRDRTGELVGLAPWYLREANGGRILAFLGSGEVCTDYTTLLAAPGAEEAVTREVSRWLIAGLARWDVLELHGTAADDPTINLLVEQLRGAGCGLLVGEELRAWRIALPASWEEYLAMLSKSHRKQVRRIQTRVLDSGVGELHTAHDAESLRRGMAIFRDLHQRRRASLGEPGCFANPKFAHFLELAAERLLAAGQLGLHWATLDGVPVSVEFNLEGGGVTYGYQSGVDPGRLEEEPGRITAVALLRKGIERGDTGFDYLRGDEPYKAHWRAEPRPLRQLRVTSASAAGRLRYGLLRAGDAVKDLLKGSLAFTGLEQR